MTSGSEPWVEISIDLGNSQSNATLKGTSHSEVWVIWVDSHCFSTFQDSSFPTCEDDLWWTLITLENVPHEPYWQAKLHCPMMPIRLWNHAGVPQAGPDRSRLWSPPVQTNTSEEFWNHIALWYFTEWYLSGKMSNVNATTWEGVQLILMLFTFSIIFKELQLC